MVKRGIRTYDQLVDENQPLIVSNKPNGRSPELIQKRDEALLYRFYFKSKIERKNYEDSISDLVNEFFISKLQIQKIIQSKADIVLQIKKAAPGLSKLKDKYSFFKW